MQVGDLVATVGRCEPSDHVSSQDGLLLSVVIDGYPTLLRLDASTLVGERVRRMSEVQDDGRQGWALTDDTLHHAGGLDSTLHTLVSWQERT